MRRLLLAFAFGAILAGCSGDEPKRLGPDDVSVEELRALVPVDSFPTGFREIGPSPNAPPVATPSGTYAAVFFTNDSGSSIGVSVIADGKASVGDPVKSMCREWQNYSGAKDCPVKREQAPAVGDDAAALQLRPRAGRQDDAFCYFRQRRHSSQCRRNS